MTRAKPSSAQAAYRAACRVRREAIAMMHAREGTYATAKAHSISRQRVQAIVKRWKSEQEGK